MMGVFSGTSPGDRARLWLITIIAGSPPSCAPSATASLICSMQADHVVATVATAVQG